MSGYGMLSHIGIGMQGLQGSSYVNSLEYFPIIDESLTQKIELLQEESQYSRFPKSPFHEGSHLIEGRVNMDANPVGVGWFLNTISNSYSVSGHAHKFQLGETDFNASVAGRPFTFVKNFDVGSALLLYDLQATSFDLNITEGEIIGSSINVIGAGFSRKAAGTPDFPMDKPFNWSQSSVTIDSLVVNDLMELNLTVERNISPLYSLVNSKSPYKLKREDSQTAKLTGVMVFQAHSYMQAFEAQNNHTLVANFVGIDSPNVFKMDFPKVKFTSFEVLVEGPGVIEAKFNADVLYHSGSNTQAEFTLTNVRTLAYATYNNFILDDPIWGKLDQNYNYL